MGQYILKYKLMRITIAITSTKVYGLYFVELVHYSFYFMEKNSQNTARVHG